MIPLGCVGGSHSRLTEVAVVFTTLGGPWPVGAREEGEREVEEGRGRGGEGGGGKVGRGGEKENK